MDLKSIKNKISVGVGACLLLTALGISLYASLNLRNTLLSYAEVQLVDMARNRGAVIQAAINHEQQAVAMLAQTLTAARDDQFGFDLGPDAVKGFLRMPLNGNQHLAGMYSCWEPGVIEAGTEHDGSELFDKNGRFAVYVRRDDDNSPVYSPLLRDAMRAPGGEPGRWYSVPRDSRQTYVSEPFQQEIKGRKVWMFSIVEPIMADSTFYGVVGLDLKLDLIQELVTSLQENDGHAGDHEEMMVISNQGILTAVSRDPLLIGEKLTTVHPGAAEDLGKLQAGREAFGDVDGNLEVYLPIFIGASDRPWAINMHIPLAGINSEAATAMWKMVLLGVAGFFSALIVIRYMVTGIVGPLSQVVDLAGALARGDLTRRLNLNRDDEIGDLAGALDQSCESLSRMITDITANAELQAGASHEMSSVSSQLAATSEEMNAQFQTVAGATEEMSASITSMASASEEMSVNIQSVSSTAEQMSQNMNSIAASIEQMSTTVEDVALSARDGSIIAKQAMEMSGTATTTMEILGKAAREIGEVTSLIKRIADQTNLLALNATIEAASAGDAGKGFAVVANEIKELANQSGQAANEISKRVQGVQANSEQAVESIIGITDIIQRMNESSNIITASVEEQTSTALEISDSVQQATAGIGNIANSIAELARGANDVSKSAAEAARAVNEVSANIQGLSQAAGETNNGAQQVNTTAGELARIASQLRDLASRFKVVADEIADDQQGDPGSSPAA